MTDAIEVAGLRKSFGSTAVLHGIDLTVAQGTIVALLGPNGAGKTTLVRILSTLSRADAGSARVLGHDVATEPSAVRGLLGLTGQYAAVDGLLMAEENLVMVGRLLHLGRATARRRSRELLERFELTEATDRRVSTYSGGMRRRLDLAASLLSNPPVLVLDEPTTGLDPRSRRALWEAVRGLAADGATILLTTQYLEEADQLADRVTVLHQGRIMTEGSARDLKRQVGSERLTVTLTQATDVGRARALVGGSSVHSGQDDRTLSAPVDGPEHLRDLLNRLAQAGIAVADVTLSAPTLDDVFFAVTAATEPLEAVR